MGCDRRLRQGYLRSRKRYVCRLHPYFLSGPIAYVLFRKVKPRLPLFLMPPWIAALLCAFMARPSRRNAWWFTLILGITLPLFRPLRVPRLVQVCHHTAQCSYGIYLVRPFAITIGLNLLHNFNSAIQVAAIFASLALSVIAVSHLLEKPMIDLGARVAARIEECAEREAAPI
jgi:peptidoglycan/LPS O-acetylase OafA/YrhL